MTNKDSLEELFLLKYRLELTPHQDLKAMKEEAADMLNKMCAENKLYEVKK